MKILHVPHAYAPVLGGTETQIRRVGECLALKSHDVRVLTTNVSAVDGYYVPLAPVSAPSHEVINQVHVFRRVYSTYWNRVALQGCEGIPFSRAKWKAKGFLRAFGDARFMGALRSHIESWQPDVVVALPHLVKNVELVLRVREKLPFPLVMLPLLHESDPNWPLAAVKQALTLADAVVANTVHEKARLVSDYCVPEERVFIGGMGVDTGGRKAKQRTTACTVTFFGRKKLSKGIPMLLKAMSLVWQNEPSVKLILAGARTVDRQSIDEIIARLPPSHRQNVESMDDVSEAERNEILLRTDLLVLPSMIESFGGVVLEAWACAVPVLVLDTPVFRCIVDDELNGFLVPPSEEAIAHRILFGVHNPAKLKAMGEAGLSKAESQYSWPAVSDRFLEAYEFASGHAAHGRSKPVTLRRASQSEPA